MSKSVVDRGHDWILVECRMYAMWRIDSRSTNFNLGKNRFLRGCSYIYLMLVNGACK